MNRGPDPPVPRPLQERDRAPDDPLAALAEGDAAPFEVFVETETPLLLSFFQGLGARRSESEDLVQETFLKLFRSREHYTSRGLYRGYTYRVARNVWIDRARRKAHEPRPEPTVATDEAQGTLGRTEDPGATDPARSAATAEAGTRIAAAIERLPEGQRLAFELGVVRELPYHEVAEALEIPVGTVKSRVYHAVRRLRELLEPFASASESSSGEVRAAVQDPAPGPSTADPLRLQTGLRFQH